MKSNSETEIQTLSTRFLPEFANETDRGCVLMVAVMAEGMLEEILIKKMVKTPDKEEPMFAPHAPLDTFNSKINLAYRLGLISEKLRRDLHILRKMRNHFAHHIFDCNFNDRAVKSQLSELIKSIGKFSTLKNGVFNAAKHKKEWTAALKAKEEKADFLVCAVGLNINLLFARAAKAELPAIPAVGEPLYWKRRSALGMSVNREGGFV